MHERFRSLLAANPSDSTIGLVYADWLSEQGADEESYWRDPRVYAQVWTAIFDGFDDFCQLWDRNYIRSQSGDGLMTGHQDGDGRGSGDGYGDSCGNGYGDGFHDYYYYGHGDGNGSGGWKTDGMPLEEVFLGKPYELNVRNGHSLRFEVLMEGKYVLVCDMGFILVGDVSPHPSDWQRVLVDHCATVRQWGTTRGLGQLALEGPQPETILDYEGDGVDVLRATILRAIPCNETAWEKYPDAFIHPAE